MSRQHYCTQITKWGIFKQCPFVYVALDNKLCCGFHNTACMEEKDDRGLKGNSFCVFASIKNRIKGALRILFF